MREKTSGNLFQRGKLPDDRSKTDEAHVVTMNKTASHVLYKEEFQYQRYLKIIPNKAWLTGVRRRCYGSSSGDIQKRQTTSSTTHPKVVPKQHGER